MEALRNRGFHEVKSRSTKYTVFTKDHCSFYFVGARGALRKGESASNSYAVENLRASLLAEVSS